jgi:hypothetical protein
MTASSTVASTRIWMHARYAGHRGIRSDEMTLVMLGATVKSQEENPSQGDMVCSYNTMLEMFAQKQRACKVAAMAQRRRYGGRYVETPR